MTQKAKTTATPPTPPAPTDGKALQVLRQIEGGPQLRALAIDSESIDKEARTVEVAVSSEYPVRRWFGMEVLDHSADAIDMHRLQAGAPLLDSHRSYTDPLGVVEEAWLDGDRRLRARVRFGKGERAEEVWQDVVDLIRRNISCGYLIHEMVLERSDDNLDHYRVTRWEPFEVSSVAVPADPTVGVGRSNPETTNTITIRGTAMPKPNEATNTAGTTDQPQGGQRQHAEPADPIKTERQRCADISALGEMHNRRDLAQAAIEGDKSLSDFMRELRDATGAPSPTATPAIRQGDRDLPSFTDQQRGVTAAALGATDKEVESYSLMRALDAAATGKWDKAGVEREMSVAVANKLGKEARGIFVPHDVLLRTLAHHPSMSRGLSVGTAGKGGELVATDLLVDQFIDILRNRTVIAQLGARMLSGLEGEVDIPKKVNASNFYWLAEGADVTESDFDLSLLTLKPKTVAGAISVTRKLRKQASRSAEALIIDDLMNGIGVAIDHALIHGDGLNNTPTGLKNQVGVGALEFPSTGIDWASVVAMETKISTYNADVGALAYLTSVAQRGAAKTKQAFEGTGERLWTKESEVNGYRSVATNQMSGADWLFGDFSQILIGMWGVLDLKPDPYAKAASDGLVVRVFQDVDTNVRRPEAFCHATQAAAV